MPRVHVVSMLSLPLSCFSLGFVSSKLHYTIGNTGVIGAGNEVSCSLLRKGGHAGWSLRVRLSSGIQNPRARVQLYVELKTGQPIMSNYL